MANAHFISDLHLSHKNMAIKRGFSSVLEHDEYIISQWNKKVHKNDVTYILGDVTMETHNNYYLLDRLKGSKIVILGNHDMKNHVKHLLNHVDSVAGMVKYSVKGYPKIFLTHCPIHPMELNHRVGYNIHGHIHEHLVMKTEIIGKNNNTRQVPDTRYINVACEQVDYTPQLLKELIKI
jgi:calcineurin-like phosphoesterase family protein